jgi:hypothetical protein
MSNDNCSPQETFDYWPRGNPADPDEFKNIQYNEREEGRLHSSKG